MTADVQIANYLATLRAHLYQLSSAEQEEIIQEIAAHIRDSVEKSNTSIEDVLLRLGPPEGLAAQYREEVLIGRASHSFSPVVLLRAALCFSARGLFGIFVSVVGSFGYFLGGGLVLFGLLASLWSFTHRALRASVSPWIDTGYILLVLAAGCIVLLLTTLALRRSLRIFLQLRTRIIT